MLLDRTIAPASFQIEEIRLPSYQKSKLQNGLDLVSIIAGKQQIVKIEFVFEAGVRYEQQNGESFFAIKMLSEGTSNHTAAQIAESFDQYGASIELTHGVDRSSLGVFTLSKHLPKLLPLIKEMIIDSTFDEKELSQMKNIIKQNLKVQQEKTAYVAGQVFKEKAFGETHPLGVMLNPDAIDAVSREQIMSFYEKYIKQSSFTIFVSGLFHSSHLELLDQTFGSEKLFKTSVVEVVTPKAVSQEVLIEKDGALQSTIRIGRPMFNRLDPDFFSFMLMSDVLGGYFGSRFMKNIREDKGYTYGISSSLVPFSNTGYWIIGTDVKREATQPTLDEIRKEMDLLKTELVSDEELKLVKNYKIGALVGDLNTPFEVADRVKMLLMNGLPDNFYDTYIQDLNAVSAEQIQAMANKYLTGLTEVVVGGK